MFNKQCNFGYKALENISFSIYKGDIVGVIGLNGAGKSTLLKILAGTLSHSTGTVTVNGSIGAILELGAGFNPEFTGRENALLYAKTLGVEGKNGIKTILEDIKKFSELGDFFDYPLKTYSSGMIVRLAFAVTTHFDAEILIVDEALSVGDSSFQLKSFEKMKILLREGKTMFFCSHSMYHIQSICTKTIYLSEGRLKSIGNTQEVIKDYENDLYQSSSEKNETINHNKSKEKIGNFLKFTLSVNNDLCTGEITSVNSGLDDVRIDILCNLNKNRYKYSIGLAFFDLRKMPICSSATHFKNIEINGNESRIQSANVTFKNVPLLKGKYSIDFFLMSGDGMIIFDHAKDVFILNINQNNNEVGVVSIPSEWEIKN